MRILIDADGCPVVQNAINVGRRYNLEVIILCDTSHVFDREYAKTITVSKGADSVDFALVNMINKNDIVITQDYGLAAMCLAKEAFVISQDGFMYTSENIDSLLFFRHTAKKIRNSGGRLKGNAKRDRNLKDTAFEKVLTECIEENLT